jgi:LysM repeat protein
VEDSYRDHTDYLLANPRYTFLFAYSHTDYKSWAKGLKRAGYATAPRYADMLIKIIKDNNLHQYDAGGISATPLAKGKRVKKNKTREDDGFTVSLSSRKIRENNRIDYIIVKEGDTFEKLTVELELLEWELYKYNNLDGNAGLEPGQLLYLQPKRNRAARGNDYHLVEPGETMYDISQKYGVKLKKLYKKNLMEEGTQPTAGQKIWLRKKKRD